LKPRLSIDLHGREVRVDDLNSSSLSNFDAFGEPCLDDAQVNHIAHCHDLGRRRQRDREREREGEMKKRMQRSLESPQGSHHSLKAQPSLCQPLPSGDYFYSKLTEARLACQLVAISLFRPYTS
jgi:hypothetical protein